MNVEDLPYGDEAQTSPRRGLAFCHFPTAHQAAIWRNWEIVPVDRLGQVLGASENDIVHAAGQLGLRVPPRVNPQWLTRGYQTIIRNNWHLLPYDQLLTLLGWDAAKLAFILKEEDFLWVKMGFFKPRVDAVRFRLLNAEEEEATVELKTIVATHFPPANEKERAFDFLERFENPTGHALIPTVDKRTHDSAAFDLRMIYSYAAQCGDPLRNPELDPHPEGLLKQYQALGINGLWLHGLLYTLFPWRAAPDLSAGYEKRLRSLQEMCERAAAYGIGLYLYLNEPRGLPLSFYDTHPNWKGVICADIGAATLCTSNPEIIEFLRNGTRWIFEQVPQLSGLFTITMSENPTNCFSRGGVEQCPRCRERSAPEVIAEINRAIAEGAHGVNPDARVIAYTWGWQKEWIREAIDLLPTDIEVMCVSEELLATNTGGIRGTVRDYTMSKVGPGEHAKDVWQHAARRGMKTVAKVQLNSTWECSFVPYLPVPQLVKQHIENLEQEGVGGLMLSWTMGGYPSSNLELMHKDPRQIAIDMFGSEAADTIVSAWKHFSKAFKEFPFTINVAYFSPQNYAPMNLLHLEPTGLESCMVGLPHDDLEKWRDIYPADVFEAQFRKLSEKWKQGLDLVEQARGIVPADKHANLDELHTLSLAAYCHFRSTYLQITFVRTRDRVGRERSDAIVALVEEERELAKTLHAIVASDSRIGFEASNHYYYTLNDLKEKVLNCEEVRRRICCKS